MTVGLDKVSTEIEIRGDYDHSGSIEDDEIKRHLLADTAKMSVMSSAANGTFTSRGTFESAVDNPLLIHLSASEADDRYIYVFRSGQIQALNSKI